MNFDNGEILLLNKPLHWTSFDVVKKIKKKYGKQIVPVPSQQAQRIKVGHAGTLDPLATGLLIVCTGKCTKKISEIQSSEKEYTGSMMLGATTPSYDLETEINEKFDITHITNELIFGIARKMSGKIMQTPPLHSAVKIDGERAYKKARRGEHAFIAPKEVNISEFEITNIRLPQVDFRVVCSKGTYIRSLVNDFGKALHSGAYLASLCRTRIGHYKLENAMEVDF